MENVKKYLAEFIGTLILVLFGCGSAIVTSVAPSYILLIPFAFGLTLMMLVYMFGDVSGCHVNPAVSFALLIERKIEPGEFFGYILSQIAGALCAGCILKLLLSIPLTAGIGANVLYNNSLTASLIVEIILTAVFVMAVLFVSTSETIGNLNGVAIGGALALVHIIGVNLTGTSVNPARSLVAIFSGKAEVIDTLPIFVIGPLIGAAIAAGIHIFFMKPDFEYEEDEYDLFESPDYYEDEDEYEDEEEVVQGDENNEVENEEASEVAEETIVDDVDESREWVSEEMEDTMEADDEADVVSEAVEEDKETPSEDA